jgi:XTP/dITP diphosphohydrolase
MEVGKQGNSADLDNNAKLLRLMAGVAATHRGARFRCVLALTRIADPAGGRPGEAGTRLFEGRCEGRIDIAPKGVGGFGYDPLFIPEGYASSFAELGEEVKNRISHRAEALGALLKFLRQPM